MSRPNIRQRAGLDHVTPRGRIGQQKFTATEIDGAEQKKHTKKVVLPLEAVIQTHRPTIFQHNRVMHVWLSYSDSYIF